MDDDSTCCIRGADDARAPGAIGGSGELKRLWLASDAETHFAEQVCAEAAKAGVLPDRSKTGRELMELAGVRVFTAVVSEYLPSGEQTGQKREAKNGETP